MPTRSLSNRRLPALALGILAITMVTGGRPGVIRELTLDPEAEVVELFAGETAGQLKVLTKCQDAYQANVLVTNLTDEPLTVDVPEAVVAVHVHSQFGASTGFGNGFFGPGASGQGNNGSGASQGLNQFAQTVGGTLQPGASGQTFPGGQDLFNGSGNSSGQGFFSIPPQSTVGLKLTSVCLEYGRREPSATMTYSLRPVESFSSDPALAELLASLSPRVSRDAMQAAAWHLASDLDWAELQSLPKSGLQPVGARLFTTSQLRAGAQLVEQAMTARSESSATREVRPASIRTAVDPRR